VSIKFLLLLKQFQLLGHCGQVGFFFGEKEFHLSELFVGNAENTYFSFGGQTFLDAFDVHFGVFFAGTMPQVDGKLKHIEAVVYQRFPKLCGNAALPFGFGWQIKKN